MSKKIAVLVNEDTMQRCSCGGCLKAFMNKADSLSVMQMRILSWSVSRTVVVI